MNCKSITFLLVYRDRNWLSINHYVIADARKLHTASSHPKKPHRIIYPRCHHQFARTVTSKSHLQYAHCAYNRKPSHLFYAKCALRSPFELQIDKGEPPGRSGTIWAIHTRFAVYLRSLLPISYGIVQRTVSEIRWKALVIDDNVVRCLMHPFMFDRNDTESCKWNNCDNLRNRCHLTNGHLNHPFTSPESVQYSVIYMPNTAKCGAHYEYKWWLRNVTFCFFCCVYCNHFFRSTP